MAVTRNPNLGPSPIRAKKRRLFFVRFYIVYFFCWSWFSVWLFSGHEKIIIKNIIISGNATARMMNPGRLSIGPGWPYWQLFPKSNFFDISLGLPSRRYSERN